MEVDALSDSEPPAFKTDESSDGDLGYSDDSRGHPQANELSSDADFEGSIPLPMQRLEGVLDACIALGQSIDKRSNLVVDWSEPLPPPNAPPSSPPLPPALKQRGDSPAPHVLPAGSLHPVCTWWYNFTKKEGIGAMVDLHISSMLVWNATEHLPAQMRKRVADVLGACQERLGSKTQ